MIRSEFEYKKALQRLKEDAEYIRRQRDHLIEAGLEGEMLERAMHPALSFHEQLREEVDTYERMRRGDVEALHTLTGLGRWLIGLRIARGWSQKELAKRLSVSEAQVSRDEANEYHNVSTEKAQRILEALGASFSMELDSLPPDHHPRESLPV
jgi:DNA-binding XRE family transcriptional regulator